MQNHKLEKEVKKRELSGRRRRGSALECSAIWEEEKEKEDKEKEEGGEEEAKIIQPTTEVLSSSH